MPITSEWIITHDGVSYPAGEVVTVLSEEQEQALIASGIAKKVPVVVESAAGASSSGDGGDQTDEEDALTPDEFAALSAADQKKELDSLGIEAGTNADIRLQQYSEWYDKLESENDPEL